MSYIPSGLLTTYYEVADEFLTSNLTSSLCTVYYQGKKEACSCTFSGYGGGYSQSIFNDGGPAPANHDCPYCDNTGYLTTEVTENIRLRLSFDKTKWKSFATIQVPNADLATIGFKTDIPKIKKCSYIKCPLAIAPFADMTFSLASEPLPHGFNRGDRYFVAFWERM